ncbi:hypothetical protein HRR83_004138 [Exophiala dermatitidis]|uniref:FAD dependent oxidoreductase domain-containing protein n=2 Tax=Exophiala dermatitidis TaxID=5970 RepID=H6BRK8_EXODN|nr:uncharacterized protein HMPREF1120_02902 [Exophiala dermatitidis NIH/UT8656]KAJ4507558.1 hypothetical protein HRR73_007781 [Exophiala dermatitidis]EHY54737.1 hypothetical protein HMPREF1120_02902 [Exophiala dermatitidis NIH/UT8656]KAJ4521558.1 hypothetical protein HRR74_003382 [Exophiala dermatitidis]KAJ4533360.1 hypothetical protein HRR77_008708 [Exophiala dermatitidis]KAJ4545002.1 hypothetical protein HRR76_003034 [Exophiala dermatitidis]
MSFPHPNPMPSYWLSESDSDLSKHRTTEMLPQEADVVVIGSGYSGAAAAYYILQEDESADSDLNSNAKAEGKPKVLILEARDACSGATGRNGGHILPNPYFSEAKNEERYGPQTAQELTAFEIQQVFDVKRLVEKENIDCDFELTRAIGVFLDRREAEPTVAAYKDLKKRGYGFPDDLHFISDQKKAEQVSGVKGALVAFSHTAASLWPYKLVMHLLRRCLDMGANVQTHTPVVGIDRASDGSGGWIVKTPRGSIQTSKIIVATNAYLPALLPEFKDKIVPARGIACRIAVPENPNRPAPHLNNSYTIRFGPQEYDYLISRTDGSIVVGGAKQRVLLNDAYWQNNTDDSQLIPGAAGYFDGYMQRLFHGWEDSGAKVTHIWTGVMGYSADLMPWVGEVPDEQGVYVLAGYTGHGMPRILGCAKAIAALVRGEVRSMEETDVPAPYWITADRMARTDNVAREYMAGSRPARASL